MGRARLETEMSAPATVPTETLPALIDRATEALSNARTSGEVLEARDMARTAYDAAKSAGRMARAKDAHDTLMAEVHRAQAHALSIRARAEMRLAEEYDAAQERGEVRKNGQRGKALEDDKGFYDGPASVSNLGLRHDEIHEARQMHRAEQADPGVVERTVNDMVDRGEEPTRAALRREMIERTPVRGTTGTGENEWYTPQDLIERARRVLGVIDVDPASSEQAQESVQARKFFDQETDGLAQDWLGNVWMNPPYAQPFIAQFVEKLVGEVENGNCAAAIALTHNYTDTKWFQVAARAAKAICFTRGRVRFVSPSGNLAAPTQGQAFFYFGHEVERFQAEFADVGFVVEVRDGQV